MWIPPQLLERFWKIVGIPAGQSTDDGDANQDGHSQEYERDYGIGESVFGHAPIIPELGIGYKAGCLRYLHDWPLLAAALQTKGGDRFCLLLVFTTKTWKVFAHQACSAYGM
jgi:hypothetical protein